MYMTPENAAWFADKFGQLVNHVGQVVLGKPEVIRLTFACLLSEGHLLLEDVPGTGKTSLAKALANTIHGTSSRVQFTPDLLPSDVTGVTVFDQPTSSFEFHPGPIFASIVLADEINRASPKTQSALLEVMEESAVTVDGVTHPVGPPFMVIATQNPIEQAGTYRLPEAQLDRFLMKTSLGHPDTASAVRILGEVATRARRKVLEPLISTATVTDMTDLASTVYIDPRVLEYITHLAEGTRAATETILGVSQRGAIAMVRASRTWAASLGRPFVIPDDVKHLAQPVFAHRLVLESEAEFAGVTAAEIIARVLGEVRPPQIGV